MADGYNDWRNFRTYEITVERYNTVNSIMDDDHGYPLNGDDYNADGYQVLRQCAQQAVRVTEMAADTGVCSSRGGEDERKRREFKKAHLDAYSRRHEAHKTHHCQAIALRWLERRQAILQGQRPQPYHTPQLDAENRQMRAELVQITDDSVYAELWNRDSGARKWIQEDPGLNQVLTWLRDPRR